MYLSIICCWWAKLTLQAVKRTQVNSCRWRNGTEGSSQNVLYFWHPCSLFACICSHTFSCLYCIHCSWQIDCNWNCCMLLKKKSILHAMVGSIKTERWCALCPYSHIPYWCRHVLINARICISWIWQLSVPSTTKFIISNFHSHYFLAGFCETILS